MFECLVRGFEIIRRFLVNLIQRYLIKEILKRDGIRDQVKIVSHFIKLTLAYRNKHQPEYEQ